MAVILKFLVQQYRLITEEYTDKRVPEWPLMSSPFPMATIVGLYLWFVIIKSPEFMKNRQPFQLDRTIQMYNLVQVFVCAYLFCRFASEYWPFGELTLYCVGCIPGETTYFKNLIWTGYLYFLTKIFDLLDTIFFVLRKKRNQVTFLHLYHHAFMTVFIWIFLKYKPCEQTVLLPTINSFVHTIMYFYYFLVNYNKEYRKNMWWKKHLTQLQIAQFMTLLLHGISTLFQTCNFPTIIVWALIPQNLFITIMFLDFYVKTYWKKKST